MAGIGPICTDQRELLKRAEYRASLTVPGNELEIFCSLCVGRVFYLTQQRRLYFVDAPTLSVSAIIKHVFKGLQQRPHIRQLYMDEHRLIKAAQCIEMTPRQARQVLVALSISGLHIDRVQAHLTGAQ